MASKKERKIFNLVMSVLVLILLILLFLMFKEEENNKKNVQVKEPVTTMKIAVKKVVANRVVRDDGVKSDSNSNGPVTVGLSLGGISFDLKNSK